MRILVLNWMDIKNPNRGGAELYIWETCKRLVKGGNKVTLLTSKFKLCKEREFIDGIDIIRLGSIITFFIRAFYWTKSNENGFDLFIETINGPPFMLPMILNNRRQIVVIFHLPTFYATCLKLLILGPFEFVLSRLLLRIFYKNKLIVTDSFSSKWELERLGFNRIIIAEDGISEDMSEYYDSRFKELSAVIIGPLKPWKRIEQAITGFAYMPSTWKLEIIGGGRKRYLNKLKKLVNHLRIGNRVRFYGFVTDYDKNIIIKKSLINIITSEKEGFGLTALECGRLGSVCVAYDVQGIRDAIIPNLTGILVKNGDVEKLGKALYSLSQDVDKLFVLSKSAFEYSKNFTWDSTYDKIKPFIGKN